MKKSTNDIEAVLEWFSDLDSVPLKTRQNFFAHVQAVGGIDLKASNYLEQVIEEEEQRAERRALVLNEKQFIFGSAVKIQENPETSLAQKISDSTVAWIEDKYQGFKNLFDATQKQKNKQEETLEQFDELDEVAAIKASLT